MKHRLPIAFFLAVASAHASWMPDSPILRVGEDVDLYFTARARLDYDSNLFFGGAGSLPKGGASWTAAPGLSADFFKEANFSSSFNYRRDFVRFFSSALTGLDDQRDVGGATFTYDGGGPLTLQAEASYQEDARNTAELLNFTGDAAGTLLRQTLYAQSATIAYRLTEKLNVSLVGSHRSNRYDPRIRVLSGTYNTRGLTESDGWTFPLNIRFQARERLNIGFAYEHGHTNISPARLSNLPVAHPGFTKDFYGLTLSGQPTTSGKLDTTIRVGSLHSQYDGGVDARNSLSYSISATHTLTEKLNHTLMFSDDASIAANGMRSEGRSAQYILNYVMNEGFRASAFVGYTTSNVEPATSIRTGSFGINATYSPDSHWTYTASYTLTQAYDPSTYNVHQFSLEANLRW